MHNEFNSDHIQDPEGKMAKADLYRAAKMSIKLFQMIQDNQQLESWVQAKLTKSADYLDSIYHYLEYQMKFGPGGSHDANSVADLAGELDSTAEVRGDDMDDTVEMEESRTYEQTLSALLEGAIKKETTKTSKHGAPVKAKKEAVQQHTNEGWADMMKDVEDRQKAGKTTGKFDKKKVSTGTVYSRKAEKSQDKDDASDKKSGKAKKSTAVDEGVVDDLVDVTKKAASVAKKEVGKAVEKAKASTATAGKAIKNVADAAKVTTKKVAKNTKRVVAGKTAADRTNFYKDKAVDAIKAGDREGAKKMRARANKLWDIAEPIADSKIPVQSEEKSEIKENADLSNMLKLAGMKPLNG